MNTKSTPIKVTGKRNAPHTPTQTTNDTASASASPASPFSSSKVRKQQPIELQVLFFNAVAIAVVAAHAFPM
jgi:hypothetical protein